jgi:hypothetical protein
MNTMVKRNVKDLKVRDIVCIKNLLNFHFERVLHENLNGEWASEARDAALFGDLIREDLPIYIHLFTVLLMELNKIDPENMVETLHSLLQAIQDGTIRPSQVEIENASEEGPSSASDVASFPSGRLKLLH